MQTRGPALPAGAHAETVPAEAPGALQLLLANRVALAAGLVVLGFVIVAAVAPLVAPHDPSRHHPDSIRVPPFWAAPPGPPNIGGDGGGRPPGPPNIGGDVGGRPGGSARFLLGTDGLGRDLLSRILFGARVSILLGVVVVLLTLVIGTGLGMLAGYYRGWFDTVMSRVVDTLLAFPFLIFGLAIMAVTGPNLAALVLVLAFKGWVDFFRVARGDVLAARESDYVMAARGVGAGNARILFGEILPNIVPPLIVLATLRVATVIISEASLSFLGIGVPPSIPAWGTMVADGRGAVADAWWIATFPGLAILLLVLSTNLLGEGLRDALDPRMRE